MISIKVKFYGVIKDIIKEPAAEFELEDGATMSDLLDLMRRKYGDEFAQRVLDDRIGVRTYVKLFLNDEEVDNASVSSTKLSAAGASAAATLYVMPSSTGGASLRHVQLHGRGRSRPCPTPMEGPQHS